MSEFTKEIAQGLLAPFPPDQVEFLARATSGNQAMACAYIDARDVMSRLDAVVGSSNWSFDFDPLSVDGRMVRGRLTIFGVSKCDAGQAGSEDEPLKSAVSDALKRSAVHFGIGRYLYYLPRIWAPYDSQKKRFVEQPQVAPNALARALRMVGYEGSAPAAQPPRSRPESTGDARVQQAVRNAERPATPIAAGAPEKAAPADLEMARPTAPSAPSYACSKCGKSINERENDWSIRHYTFALCRDHQDEAKAEKAGTARPTTGETSALRNGL